MMRIVSLAVKVFLCLMLINEVHAADALLKVGDRPPALNFKRYKSQEVIDWPGLKNRVVVI